MADWFANPLQQGHAGSRPAMAAVGLWIEEVAGDPAPATDRYAAVVQALRDREADDRRAREKRLSEYRQSISSGQSSEDGASAPAPPVRLYRFPTRVPCRVTPEARALLDRLREEHADGVVAFQPLAGGRQAILVGGAGTEPKQIGWVEHSVQKDPKLCNVRHQGLAVETDGGTMLVLRFRHPRTTVRMASRRAGDEGALRYRLRPPEAPGEDSIRTQVEELFSPPERREGLEAFADAMDEVAWVDFTEIRPALESRAHDEGSPPRLVMFTPPEVEMMNALASRDFEAFYARLKHEVMAGLWPTLAGLLLGSAGSQWHRGSYYTVQREPDPANGRIHQRTVDDSGRVVDVGSDRTYDAATAADILLLYLAGDVLADLAEIYFAIQRLRSADTYRLKEEFFSVLRRFWSAAESPGARYGSEHPALVRMSLRAVPTPAQAALLREDWINLRQILIDRYGEAGRCVGEVVDRAGHRPSTAPLSWPFAAIPAGEINVGLRLVYRQEWRHLGSQRGEVVRTVPLAPEQAERVSTRVVPRTKGGRAASDLRSVQTTTGQSDTTRNSMAVVDEAARATAEAMKWSLEAEGSINTGFHGLGTWTDLGLESECRESSRHTCAHLCDTMLRMASKVSHETRVVVSTEAEEGFQPSTSIDIRNPTEEAAVTYVYSKLQNQYEVLTRVAEIQNVVMVAEKLPSPAEIDYWWVKQHDWILAKVLLDESFRDALDSIRQEPRFPSRGPCTAEAERLRLGFELDAKRDRLYEHLRANILHYQRAVWQQEDPQQRSLRYKKLGRKMPLEWRFELATGGAPTLVDLAERLLEREVEGQFAAYSGGREADLEQVIHPAGPIGYYGNYAIYLMRPEFAGENLFSMLHFFKSPYLRPDAETGRPEVADPVQIHLSADPAVADVGDRVIDQHHDEMLRYLPELRLELARGRRRVGDGADPGAVDRAAERHAAMRRHYAEYLFRRERSRRIVLDTNSLVTDVVYGVGSARERLGHPPRAADLPPATEERGRLAAENGPGIRLLGTSGERAGEGERLIVVHGDDGLIADLIAGAGAPPAPTGVQRLSSRRWKGG